MSRGQTLRNKTTVQWESESSEGPNSWWERGPHTYWRWNSRALGLCEGNCFSFIFYTNLDIKVRLTIVQVLSLQLDI